MSKNRYNSINKKPDIGLKINTHIPTPTEKDYKRGYVNRYFIQKTNDKGSPIYEVKSTSLGSYSRSPFYTTCSLKWRLKGPNETKYNNTGDIIDKSFSESNRIAIKLVSYKIPNLKLYLPNLLQFYKK